MSYRALSTPIPKFEERRLGLRTSAEQGNVLVFNTNCERLKPKLLLPIVELVPLPKFELAGS
jgi:hypothetical protein